jgi:hypothetical protein
LQKSANDAQVQRNAIPLANGRVDGDQASEKVRKDPSGIKGVDDRHRGGQAAEPGEARAGRSKGRRGAEVFVRWKAPPVVYGLAR